MISANKSGVAEWELEDAASVSDADSCSRVVDNVLTDASSSNSL